MRSCEVLPYDSVLNYKVPSLKIMDVEFILRFFRWMNLDSNADLNDEVGAGCEYRLKVSELSRMSSVSEGKHVKHVEI